MEYMRIHECIKSIENIHRDIKPHDVKHISPPSMCSHCCAISVIFCQNPYNNYQISKKAIHKKIAEMMIKVNNGSNDGG